MWHIGVSMTEWSLDSQMSVMTYHRDYHNKDDYQSIMNPVYQTDINYDVHNPLDVIISVIWLAVCSWICITSAIKIKVGMFVGSIL